MTVLCLVELDGGAAADVSLRALTFARALAVPGGLAAVAFGQADALQVAELSRYGVTEAFAVGPSELAGTRRRPGRAPRPVSPPGQWPAAWSLRWSPPGPTGGVR